MGRWRVLLRYKSVTRAAALTVTATVVVTLGRGARTREAVESNTRLSHRHLLVHQRALHHQLLHRLVDVAVVAAHVVAPGQPCFLQAATVNRICSVTVGLPAAAALSYQPLLPPPPLPPPSSSPLESPTSTTLMLVTPEVERGKSAERTEQRAST